MVAPVIPAITDHELESILAAAAEAGASTAGYVLLRLPYEVKDLFREWLAAHYPDRAKHVMSLIHQAREGRDNDPEFGSRMRGTGPYAELLRTRFELATRKLGLNAARVRLELDTTLFRPPGPATPQLSLGLRLNPRDPRRHSRFASFSQPGTVFAGGRSYPDAPVAYFIERELAITALPHRITGNPP